MATTPVRVSLPASVAANVKELKTAVGGILERLGCPECCSGFDIHFELQRNVFMRDGLRAPAEVAVAGVSPYKDSAPNTVHIGVSPKLADNINEVFTAIDRAAEFSGHTACTSGKDMFFELERVFVLDAKLGIAEQAMTLGAERGLAIG